MNASAAQELLERLDQTITDTGMRGRVHITGYLPDAEISRLLGASDVAAFPFNDGVTSKSGSMLTSFALGVPVIATAPPGMISAPVEMDGVLRVPPRDTEALTEALRWLLNDPALAGRLRVAGRAVAARQSWETIAATHRQIYDLALGTPLRRSRDNRSQPWQSG